MFRGPFFPDTVYICGHHDCHPILLQLETPCCVSRVEATSLCQFDRRDKIWRRELGWERRRRAGSTWLSCRRRWDGGRVCRTLIAMKTATSW